MDDLLLPPPFLTALHPEERIPASHPLRAIKKFCDQALRRLSPLFAERYSDFGRASIPPEPLLKARVLMALSSVRCERRFCDQWPWNLLWVGSLNVRVRLRLTGGRGLDCGLRVEWS